MNTSQLSSLIVHIMDESIWSPRFPALRTERLERLAHPRQDPLPKKNGIYRIHMEGVPVLAYVGQSQDLRRRVNELRGVSGSVMPFTDPHIAGPCLWAWGQMPPNRPYTVSFTAIESNAYWRQGLEDLVIAHTRWKHRPIADNPWCTAYSPLANFHKMPVGWVSSSSRSRGYRGGPTPFLHACHTPSIAPVGDLDDPRDPINDLEWGGHRWSAWHDPAEIRQDGQGLYRLRRKQDSRLLFIGHGSVDDAARNAVCMETDLLFSYVVGPWSYHEQLELLVDGLGLYLRKTQGLPLAQYGGEDNPDAGKLFPLRSLTTQTVSFLKRFTESVSQQQVRVPRQSVVVDQLA